MNRRPFDVLVAVALVVVACQQPTDDAATTMLSGLVVAGPTCPVVRDPPDPGCEDRPVVGAGIVVVDAQGREVARTETDAAGAFEVGLPPGEYQLVPQPVEGLLGTASPIAVVVVDGADLEPVMIVYDTGIR